VPGFGCVGGVAVIVWREVLRVTIPGPPVAKGRPRFFLRNHQVRTYTDKKTAAFEKLVALCVSSSPMLRGQSRPLCGTGPVRVDIVAIFPRPQRLQAKRYPDQLIAKHSRPDLDNVCKAVNDGIGLAKGLIWNDDAQVQTLRAESYYAERDQSARTELVIYIPTE
jgi:Holliday junction resolvase RusA-like endonuclease